MKEEQVPVPMLDLPPMPEKPSVPEKPSRFCLLQNICNRKFLQDDRWAERFKKFSDFKRMIYWADQPDGGIGVSFVDPVEFYKLGDSWNDAGFLDRSMQKGILDEIFSGATVLTISSESLIKLGATKYQPVPYTSVYLVFLVLYIRPLLPPSSISPARQRADKAWPLDCPLPTIPSTIPLGHI